jgi:hypothetical protein
MVIEDVQPRRGDRTAEAYPLTRDELPLTVENGCLPI